MIKNDHFFIKTKVYFDKGSMQMLRCMEGHCALVVSDSIMKELGYLQKAQKYLQEAGITSAAFTDIKPDPDVNIVAAGVEAYEACHADVLVALGGGSVIDTAKAILYFVWQRHKAAGERFDKPCFIAIPSTSGTGSEVTNFSVISANGAKNVLIDEFIAPDVAILDSICIQHVPASVIADTGMDVLVHALEAYVSTDATDFTDALAEKTAELIFGHLKKLYDDPANGDARDRVQNASCMAGIAFTNSNLGITHSLAHALGAEFHLPHGRANALMMEAVIAYNADLAGTANNYAAWKYQMMAAELNLPARTPREGTVSLMQAIAKLKREVGIPVGIHATGRVDPELFEKAVEGMAEEALRDRCTPTNPIQPTKEDLIRLYRESF